MVIGERSMLIGVFNSVRFERSSVCWCTRFGEWRTFIGGWCTKIGDWSTFIGGWCMKVDDWSTFIGDWSMKIADWSTPNDD